MCTGKFFWGLQSPHSKFNPLGDVRLRNDNDLQTAIGRLVEWTKLWQLQISIPKCLAFRIMNTQWRISDVAGIKYNIEGTTLFFVDQVRDLILVFITIICWSTISIYRLLPTMPINVLHWSKNVPILVISKCWNLLFVFMFGHYWNLLASSGHQVTAT